MPIKNNYKPLPNLTDNSAEVFAIPIMLECIKKREPILASVICKELFIAHEVYFGKTEDALFSNSISINSSGYIIEGLKLYDVVESILNDKSKNALSAEDRKFLLSELDKRLEDQLLVIHSPYRKEHICIS